MIQKCPCCGCLLYVSLDATIHVLREPAQKEQVALVECQAERDAVDQKLINVPVSALNISTRLRNAFGRYQRYNGNEYVDDPIRTIGDVLTLKREELLREPNVGLKSVNELYEEIDRLRNEVRAKYELPS